jgi:DNA repair exonuclease SbcCD ATPase subunit
MMKAKLARLMILDETFASIGWEYIEPTSKLISELADKIGLDVLLVTHQKEFQNFAKHIYKVEESPTGLQMQRIK